jgi:PAS domain S-box-containing protein
MAASQMSRFEALLDSAPDAIVLADASGRITLVNRRTEELFGYDRSELLREPVELLVPERYRGVHRGHRDGYSSDPRTREMGADLELYGLRKDGSEFPVEISLSPIHEGDETHVITIVRDVSERRAAETRFRVLLESAPDAIVLVDADARITLVNRRTEELFGYEPGELVGQQIEVLVPARLRSVHVQHRSGYIHDPRTREMGAGLELYGLRQDGSEFPVEISLSPMRDGTQERVITIVRDVSERRAAESERLELAREQAAHAEAEEGRA